LGGWDIFNLVEFCEQITLMVFDRYIQHKGSSKVFFRHKYLINMVLWKDYADILN
jgi:hypothetical protein